MGDQALRSLEALNGASRATFVATLGDIFEHSPWVAEAVAADRPFESVGALHAAMMRRVSSAEEEQKLSLVRAHPELAGQEAIAGTLTRASTGEQGRLGLTQLSPEEFARITRINAAYRTKFGFPCIIALRLYATRAGVLDEMERRLANDRQTEIANAIENIGHITRGRLDRLIGDA